jgi:hypothetical protein
MPLDGIDAELDRALRAIRDDDEFVDGTLKRASSRENKTEMLRYIESCREAGEPVTDEDMILMSVLLKRRSHD